MMASYFEGRLSETQFGIGYQLGNIVGTYFEFDAKEERYGESSYTTPVECAMDGRFEDIICHKASDSSIISRLST